MRHFQKFFAGIGGMAIAGHRRWFLLRRLKTGWISTRPERMMSFNTVDLRESTVFRTRTIPEQRPFIDQVVAKVDSGELPRAMVNVVSCGLENGTQKFLPLL